VTDYAVNRGQRIAYDVAGGGDEAVVLLHGLSQRRTDWAACGYVEGLADQFQVICVDSLGHGESDSPDDCLMYSRSQRAGDVVVVLDTLGVEKAHVVGYSMGGWLTSAVLVHAPDRLRSVCFGGWDPVHGMEGVRSLLRSKFGVELDMNAVLSEYRQQYPEKTDWITPEREPALECCLAAVEDLEGVEQALETSPVPLLFWDGRKDPHHHGSRDVAARLPLAVFLETPGDHTTAFIECSSEALVGLRKFLDASRQL
jgi:pimeloyl-ACP methyl ester carboxylesterase